MPKRILVVDDDALIRALLTDILRNEGYEVSEANTGTSALDLVTQCPPNLVLLDVQMPGLDGLEVCRRMKANPLLHDVLVALMSGKAMEGRDKAAGFTAGADEYLTKPIDLEEFPARIRMLMRLSQTSAALRASEQHYRQAEAKYRTIFENAIEGIFQTTPDGRYLSANPALARMLGYNSPEELLKSVTDIGQQLCVKPESRMELRRRLDQDGFVRDFENEIRKKDGTRIWTRVSARAVRNEAGEILYYEGTSEDITQRREAEIRIATLADLSYRLSSISTPAEASMVIMALANDLFGWDAGYLHLYSAQEDKLIPLFTADTIDGTKQEVSPASFSLDPTPLMREVMDRGAKLINRQLGTREAASLIPFGNTDRLSSSMMYVPVHFGAAVWGILSIQSYTSNAYSMDDLNLLQAVANHCGSALRRIEISEALRQSERHLRLIAENTQDVIFAFDMNAEPIFINSAVELLAGYTFAEIKERKFVNWIHPEDQPRMLALWDDLFRGKGYADIEFRLITKSGQVKWSSSTWGPMLDEAGKQIGVQGRERDVTERKELEKQVLDISAEERCRIGHELHDGLGQYLAGIALKAKALEHTLAAEKSGGVDQARELVTLVSNAISQARNLARGLDPVEVENIGLAAALQNLCWETRELFNLNCEFRCAHWPPKVNPQTELALYRIVQEAIHNASTHGRATSVSVQLGQRNDHLFLSVQDNGCGFDQANGNSNGMGLRVMRYRARSIGGELTVSSSPGKGAEVTCAVLAKAPLPRPKFATAKNRPAKA